MTVTTSSRILKNSRATCQNEICTRRFLSVLRTCRPVNHTCKVITRTKIFNR